MWALDRIMVVADSLSWPTHLGPDRFRGAIRSDALRTSGPLLAPLARLCPSCRPRNVSIAGNGRLGGGRYRADLRWPLGCCSRSTSATVEWTQGPGTSFGLRRGWRRSAWADGRPRSQSSAAAICTRWRMGWDHRDRGIDPPSRSPRSAVRRFPPGSTGCRCRGTAGGVWTRRSGEAA